VSINLNSRVLAPITHAKHLYEIPMESLLRGRRIQIGSIYM